MFQTRYKRMRYGRRFWHRQFHARLANVCRTICRRHRFGRSRILYKKGILLPLLLQTVLNINAVN